VGFGPDPSQRFVLKLDPEFFVELYEATARTGMKPGTSNVMPGSCAGRRRLFLALCCAATLAQPRKGKIVCAAESIESFHFHSDAEQENPSLDIPISEKSAEISFNR